MSKHGKNGAVDDSKFFQRALNSVERAGNALPHPVIIFVYLSLILIALSHIFYLIGTSVTYLVAGESTTVAARSLISGDGIRHMFTSAPANFTTFPPLGVVVVAMVGVGIAEHAGMINTMIKRFLLIAPKWMLTYAIMFLGIVSSIATDAGYLVLIPMAGVIFHAAGRHPLAGIAVAFAGVSASFAANVIVTPVDAILAELTNAAIHLVDPSRSVDILGNYYFSIVSSLMMTVVGALVTEKIIEPRLGKYEGDVKIEQAEGVTADEKKGLRFALYGFLITLAVMLFLTLPAEAPLRNQTTGQLIIGGSPFLSGIIFVVLLVFLIPGICYGYGAKTIQNTTDIANFGTKTMAALGSFFLLAFVIGTFLSYFNFSQLAIIISVNGANFLESLGLPIFALLLAFIFFNGTINFLIGSMSAKYAIIAPIFVPMFMQLGIAPELTQAAFRVGDSTTNIISPLMTYFALILIYCQKYDKKAGIGTVIAMMLPYTIWLTIFWTALLAIWFFLGLPLGPGVVM